MTTKIPTPEQKDAWLRVTGRGQLSAAEGHTIVSDLELLRPFISEALLGPAVNVMPTHPGWYRGYDKVAQTDVVVRLALNGNWGHGIHGTTHLADPERFAPFTRLGPGRPEITGDLLRSLYNDAPADRSAFDYIADELANGDTR